MEQSARRHVRVVCTLGPASSSADIIAKMLAAGMNVARLNMAYGSPEEHRQVIARVRSESQKLGCHAAVMLDLPGLKRLKGDMRAVFGPHLEFALSQDADFIALSFITSAQQVADVQDLLKEMKAAVPVIVKIERAEALAGSSDILGFCQGIMVARGDLALGISIEKVPLAQKRLIREANQRGKPVITATQMLESMVRSDSPTRAEATDVANAVLDGSDALMLSEETAVGSYPVQAVETMVRIAVEAETALPYGRALGEGTLDILPEVNDATARAACQIAYQVGATAIVALTTGGTTAWRVSKYRPRQPVLALTPSESVARRLSLAWGVIPVLRTVPPNLDGVFGLAREIALEAGVAREGDTIVITAGIPLSVSGGTNLLKVHRV
ncbi:MAG: pyruvate kinase [Chloroflexota bacterium]